MHTSTGGELVPPVGHHIHIPAGPHPNYFGRSSINSNTFALSEENYTGSDVIQVMDHE